MDTFNLLANKNTKKSKFIKKVKLNDKKRISKEVIENINDLNKLEIIKMVKVMKVDNRKESSDYRKDNLNNVLLFLYDLIKEKDEETITQIHKKYNKNKTNDDNIIDDRNYKIINISKWIYN
jgi:hypothetical protein